MHIQSRTRRMLLCLITLLVLTIGWTGSAIAASAKVSVGSAGIYRSTGSKSPAVKVKRGTSLTVLNEGSKWLRIRYKGKVGFIKKSAVKKAQAKPGASSKAAKKKSKVSLRMLKPGASGAAVKQVQQRLAAKGYLAKGGVTGGYGSATRTAVRKFQMFNSLSISGTATVATQKKLFSSSAKAEPKVSMEPWNQSQIDIKFPNRSSATIIDLSTGTRIRIRRLYGSNHCDVEPATKSDTVKLKAVYGGKWSWDSRGVVLIAGGKCFAAAINSMPHGGQLSRTNNYPGQFCLHLNDSKTHGSEKENADHQANVRKVYAYFN